MSVDGIDFLLFTGREFFYILVPVLRERSWSGGSVGKVHEGGKYFVKNKQESLFLFVIFFNFIQSKFMLLDSCCF